MTIAAVNSGVVTLLKAVSGVSPNVYDEDTAVFKEIEKVYDGRVHYWLVESSEAEADQGLGWSEARVNVRIRGFIGVTAETATDGNVSRKYARDLQSTVVRDLTATAQRKPGSSLGSTTPRPAPLRIENVEVDGNTVPVHVIEITWTVAESS